MFSTHVDIAEKFVTFLERSAARPLTVGLSGGTTPLALYRRLAEPPYAARIPWDRLTLFWSDERCVPADDPASNYGAARDALLARVNFPAERTRRFLVERGADAAARAYEQELRTHAPRGLDLLLLGLGEDGHTASLFPGSPALAETTAWTAATHAPDGGERVTLTFPFINRCAEIWVLAAGTRKRDVARRALARDPLLPASLLRADPPPLWLLDRDAAG